MANPSSRTIKATDNYIYSLESSVGKGATCEVFKGIHKGTGEIRALKIFQSRLKNTGIAQREIEALKSLKHDNIVDFIGEEADNDTKSIVAVMEYCEQSLYNMLCEPENRNGLTEDEFMRFFQHMVGGLKHLREHGFLHRDIKPGNILVATNDDGSHIYKLSDFGTAKPMVETEAFQSLVGTEEYLHPDIFKAAFIDQGMSREFDAGADLWSLGATLYHAATGRVPFKPYIGRNDRKLMFKMIANKEFGVIAGEQHSRDGEVKWSKELPETCRMSKWLKVALTEILARLMESNPRKAITFDQFFMAADDICERCVVYVFSTTSARHFRFYLQPECVLADVQDLIYEETNIPKKQQLINYEECSLRDIIKENDPLNLYPKMSMDTPLVMIRSTGLEQCIMPEESMAWYKTPLDDSDLRFPDNTRNLSEDFAVASFICDDIAHIQYLIRQSCLTQTLFEKTINRTERWKELLLNRLDTEVSLYRDRVKDMRHIHAAIMENGGLQCLSPADGITMEQLKKKINNCSGYMKFIKTTQTDDGGLLFLEGCSERSKCPQKVGRWLQQAKDFKLKFEGRKKAKAMPYHEEKLHKFDRKELLRLHAKSVDLWTGHCKKKLEEIHNHFLAWHLTYAELQKRIEALQVEIRSMKSSIKKYTRNFKVESDQNYSLGSNVNSVPTTPNGLESAQVTLTSSRSDPSEQAIQQGATSLSEKLEAVTLDQENVKDMMQETESLHLKSMVLLTEEDMPTLTTE